MNNFVAHAEQESTNRFEIAWVSSYPKGEFTFGGRHSGTGYRCVNETNTMTGCFGGDLLRE